MNPRIIAAALLATLCAAAPLSAQNELPKRNAGDGPLDFEPKLMLDGPHAGAVVSSATDTLPEDRIAELERALTLAEERAVESEQLLKEGILARVEVEERALRVVKARKDLADANLAAATARAAAVKGAFEGHKATQADLDAATAALKTAQQADDAASADWDKGQLDAATVDLARKQKLYSEGVGSKRDVEVAEDRVALLSGTAAK